MRYCIVKKALKGDRVIPKDIIASYCVSSCPYEWSMSANIKLSESVLELGRYSGYMPEGDRWREHVRLRVYI